MKRKNKRGFTLIEMLIVVAIIGLLATVVLLAVTRARKKASGTQMKAHVEEIMKALEMAATDGITEIEVEEGETMDADVGDTTVIYIQKVPAPPTSCSSCTYSDGSDDLSSPVDVNTSNYEIIATGFEDGETFTCKNGSCYCSQDVGCVAIP